MGEVPDVVIPVRTGDTNPELRYALRSLVNVPHGRVWIAGNMPPWVREARCIPTTQPGSKYENSKANLLAACLHDAVAEHFLYWNDDIFLLEPIDEMPVLHRGTMAAFVAKMDHLGASPYMRGVMATAELLAQLGHPEALCYELHVPLPMTKSGVLAAYEAATAEGLPKIRALQMRSLFGNLERIGGTDAADVKVEAIRRPTWEPGPIPFVSTTDAMWARRHPAAVYVSELYPDPGVYEAMVKRKVTAR